MSDCLLTLPRPSPPSASKQPAKMQNDKGANVDLYIPRKWCVARPRVRARAYAHGRRPPAVPSALPAAPALPPPA